MKTVDLERHNLSERLPSLREIRILFNTYVLAESRTVTPTREDPWGKPLPIDNAPFNARSFVISRYGNIGYMGSLRKRRGLIVDILCEPNDEKRERLISEARAITQQVIMEYGALNELNTEQILSEIWAEERRILEVEVGIPSILLDSLLNSAGGLLTRSQPLAQTTEEFWKRHDSDISEAQSRLDGLQIPNGFHAPDFSFSDIFAEIIQDLMNGLRMENPLPKMQAAAKEKISAALESIVGRFQRVEMEQ